MAPLASAPRAFVSAFATPSPRGGDAIPFMLVKCFWIECFYEETLRFLLLVSTSGNLLTDSSLSLEQSPASWSTDTEALVTVTVRPGKVVFDCLRDKPSKAKI